MSDSASSNGDEAHTYTPNSRVDPLPAAPFGNAGSAYRAAKALALVATDRFIVEKRPHFSVVNVMPGYVIGANELVDTAARLAEGSNALVIGIISGASPPGKRPCSITDVRDLARIQVEALDENKVGGNASFLLIQSGQLAFNDANDIVRVNFPEAVKDGLLPLGGNVGSAYQKFDDSRTTEIFGRLRSYEDAVVSLVRQYLALKTTV